MARPAKSVDTMSKNLTKEEYEARKQMEEKLKGGTDKIKPPTYLNKEAKKIFKYIVSELEVSGILTNLDTYVLASCSVAIDRIQESEKILNDDLFNKDALRVKESYMKEFFRLCNELSLSPQSRAKLANINIQKQDEKEDKLLQVLNGSGGGNN
ncbi:phage terminase small subunit P27 family [Clostridium formicaceticum]|uniref:Terminase n=1 Tax=Clostridium formicaceticum TaxID=1497 RepID=A0AAC9WG04_9CLOT|nr:phage terminase small subunit P27 family [Clostridium formicaceticum]AOY76908.1 terminase [Clostridium formicaceticum]ARE87388.1 Phage terminase, small subunit [Clostridium formicaceticum]